MVTANAGKRGGVGGMVMGGLLALALGVGYFVVELTPPAQSEDQALTTTVVAGDYNHPYAISGGTLHSERGAGLNAELQTIVRYEVSGTPGNGIMDGPDLTARVIHQSGAVMVCEMGRTRRLQEEGRTVQLGCDRTVDFGELNEWTTVELTPCFNSQLFDELRAEQPCRPSMLGG